VLNLVLLLPAAFFAAWALRRAWTVVLGALVLSLGVETTQAALDIGTCQAGDMTRNSAGALAGAVAGVLLARALGLRRGARRHGST
jgi:glycopeptide antibiotics resistance protein